MARDRSITIAMTCCSTIPLLEAIAPTIDVPAALFRGRYATAVVDMEARGIPISMRHLAVLRNNGRRCGCSTSGATIRSVFTTMHGSFKEDRFETLANARGWGHSWPRTATGRLSLTAKDARTTGQALPGVAAFAALARPDRRIAAGTFPQHHRCRRL